MAPPPEIDCSCVPVNVLKSDIDEGKSPFGEGNDYCYQVDSKILYENNSFVNGKSRHNSTFETFPISRFTDNFRYESMGIGYCCGSK